MEMRDTLEKFADQGGVYNVKASNLTLVSQKQHAVGGLFVRSHRGDGGTVSNVSVTNVELTHTMFGMEVIKLLMTLLCISF